MRSFNSLITRDGIDTPGIRAPGIGDLSRQALSLDTLYIRPLGGQHAFDTPGFRLLSGSLPGGHPLRFLDSKSPLGKGDAVADPAGNLHAFDTPAGLL
jgi:hypothetical protein